jgi:hypothetical protein
LTSDDGGEQSLRWLEEGEPQSGHRPYNLAVMEEALDACWISPVGIECETEIGPRAAIAAAKIAPKLFGC